MEEPVTRPMYVATVSVSADLGTGPGTEWLRHGEIVIETDKDVSISNIFEAAAERFKAQLDQEHPLARVTTKLLHIVPKGPT